MDEVCWICNACGMSIEGGFSKIEPNAKGSRTFDTHVGLLMLTINQI